MGEGKSFAETDSWAVCVAFVIFAVISTLVQNFVYYLKHHVFNDKKTLLRVLYKAEEELFLLGTSNALAAY